MLMLLRLVGFAYTGKLDSVVQKWVNVYEMVGMETS